MRWMTGASKELPPLWGPLGKRGALCNRRSTGVPVGPPRPSSITHPKVALATVTCSYNVAGTGGFLAGATRLLGSGTSSCRDTTTQRRRSVPPYGPSGEKWFLFTKWQMA